MLTNFYAHAHLKLFCFHVKKKTFHNESTNVITMQAIIKSPDYI